MSITGVILFIIILLALVLIHEFGHFIVAKWTGMRVDEFAFGFPPRLFSKKIGETSYTLNVLPLGGYVSIWGENGEPNDEAKSHSRAFGNRPWWAQLLVLIAGVTMNMLLAWVIFIGISYGGIAVSESNEMYGKNITNKALVVVDASEASPAYLAGITPRSVILSMESKGMQASLTSATSAVLFVQNHQNNAIHITYKNPHGVVDSTTVAAVYGIVPDRKVIGLSFDIQGIYQASIKDAVVIGSMRTYSMTKDTVDGMVTIFSSLAHGTNIIPSLSGPIGIAKMVGKSTEYGYGTVLTLVAMLSINLAILNILPLPALDGGRILVVIAETITRRKVSIKWLTLVNGIGVLLIIILTVLVMIHDLGY